MRKAIEYNPEELRRPINYMVVTCDKNIDTHIIDLGEAANYVHAHKRRAIIITDREVFKGQDLNILNYTFVMNATKPAVILIDNNRQPFRKVYEYIFSNFKNGLIIAYPETITNDIAHELAQSTGSGHDFLIYRNELMELTPAERGVMTYMRIHANGEFELSKGFFENIKEKFGERNTIGIFTSQFIANYQHKLCTEYFKKQSEKYEALGKEDYIDYHELNRQMAYHVYYDMKQSKILNFSKEKLKFYMELMFKSIGAKINQKLLTEYAIIFCNE